MSNHFVRKPESFAPGLPDVIIPMRTAIPSPQLSIQGTGWDSQHMADAAQPNRLQMPAFPGPLCGCHLLNFRPTGSKENYDGTLRVECHSGGYTLSGDLYRRPLNFSTSSYTTQAPNPSNGIPIFAIRDYRYYLRAIQLSELSGQFKGFLLTYELYNYEKQTQDWQNKGVFTAQMNRIDAPIGYPSPTDYFEGEVRNTYGKVIGRLKMGWVSKYLRKATIEIDRVEDTGELLNNGNEVTWSSVFSEVGWDLNVMHSDQNIPAPNKTYWTDAELHEQMLTCRAPVNLDVEWRYHLLAVKRLLSWDRGIMYDAGATDSNLIPREGAAIAAHWKIPDEPVWGEAAGQRFDRSKAPYFRTAVHEIGHAMGLEHNESDNGIMNTTDAIARNRTPTVPFPRNIIWAFSAPEQKALRHYPDILVRPGGAVSSKLNLGSLPADASEYPLENVKLNISPVVDVVPIGAPVRINVSLHNGRENTILAPNNIGLKKNFVSGYVENPAGLLLSFKPLFICMDEESLIELGPEQRIEDSITLLRGKDGALFKDVGLHKIVVKVKWSINGVNICVQSETHVMITAPVDETHARAALRILTTPDTLLTLVLGGDYCKEGNDAIQLALNHPVLEPHYAYIEAKRMCLGHNDLEADIKPLARVMKSRTAIMSAAELKKAKELMKNKGKKSYGSKSSVREIKD